MLKGRIRSASLPNGFRMYSMRKAQAEAVTVQIWVSTGSVNEGEHLGCGLSHFLEHMLFQGTKKYPGLGVADTVHSLGGDMNAYTSHSCTVYYISLPSKSFPKAVDILSEMVMRPTLPKARFKLEKGVILRERDMNLDRPERVLSEQLWREMFLQHPVRHPIIGYREKIEQVDRELAAEYHALRYSPARSFMVVVGDVDEEEAIKLGSDTFASWPMGRIDEPVLPVESAQCCRRSWSGHFHDPLARVTSGWRIPSASHNDIPALDILSCILGGGTSSRLHKKLKTELELAINISAYSYATNFEGAAGFTAICPPEKLRKLVEGSLEVFREVSENGVTEPELKRNVAQQEAEYLRGLRSNSGVARLIGGSVLTFGSPEFADKYIQDLTKLSLKDIAAVSSKYFGDSAMTITELLPDTFKEDASSIASSDLKPNTPILKTAPAGQRMIHFEDKSLPLVEFCVVLPGGSIWEPSSSSGASRLLASCIPCGTDKISETDLADLLDDEAADFSVISGNNTLSFRLNCRKEMLDKTLDVIASLLANPAIPEQQFERERRNLLDAIASRKTSPQGLAEDKFSKALYGSHPYSSPAGGSEESIKALTADAVRRFHLENCLVPSKAVFAFAGDISQEEAFGRIEKMISACKWSSSTPCLPEEPKFPAKTIKIETRLDKQQAVLMLGLPACANNHPDRDALDLLSVASNSQASNLFKTVREDKGLAYYTGMVFSSGIHHGHIAYYAGTDPKTASTVETLIEKERQRIIKKGLEKKEFEAAKECMLFDLAEEMQNTGRLIFSSALAEFYGIGFDSPWIRSKEVSKLTLKKVNEIAAKYLSSKCKVISLVSPSV